MTESEKLIEAAADPRVRNLCAETCASFGEPPCYELDAIDLYEPCANCLRDAGYEMTSPIDPNAAIRDLF